VPTLIAVGDKDATVFTSKVKEFFKLLDCKKELHLIKGANHSLGDKGNKEVFKFTNNWFKKWLK
jgi:alpha-beta hydrolase superfamily lysophospholipase